MDKDLAPTLTDGERDTITVTAHHPQDRLGIPSADLIWETPREVALPLVWLALSGGFGALQCLRLLAALPDPAHAPEAPWRVGGLRVAGYAWLAVAPAGLFAAHARLGPAVWGATSGFLFAQSAALVATLVRNVFALVHDSKLISYITDILYLLLGVFHLVLPAGAVAVSFLYFRAGWWYGVPHRRGWRTVGFSVGWMLLLTALIFGTSQVAQYRYPS